MLVDLQSFDVDVREDIRDSGRNHQCAGECLSCKITTERVRCDYDRAGAGNRE